MVFGVQGYSAVKSASSITSIRLRVGSNSDGVPSTEEVCYTAKTSSISKNCEGGKFEEANA